MQPPIGSSLANAFPNGGSSLQTNMHAAVDMSGHASRIDVPTTILPTQGSNITLTQGMNGGGIIKAETGYSGSSYMFCADGTVLDARPSIGDTSGASFSSVESNSQPLNDSLLDVDGAAYGFLGQIPRNFSLSDLTAGAFSQTSGFSLFLSFPPIVSVPMHVVMQTMEAFHQDLDYGLPVNSGITHTNMHLTTVFCVEVIN